MNKSEGKQHAKKIKTDDSSHSNALDTLLKAIPSHCNIPKNTALDTIVSSIATAHFIFLQQLNQINHPWKSLNKKPIVVMVVQQGERNFSDQRHVHFQLKECHGVSMVRLSLAEIERECVLDERTGVLSYMDSPISVVYVSSCVSSLLHVYI